jgi:hypothetical protein
MILGRVDDVDGHQVGTKFLFGLVPTESVYLAPLSKRTATLTNGMRLRLDFRSVTLAYGRVWLPIVGIALPLIEVVTGATHLVTWLLGAVLIGLSVAAHRAGHLDDEAKGRLRLLGSVTGLRVDPSRLEPSVRGAKRESLGALMEKAGIPKAADAILGVLDEIPGPALPLVYGYACYSGDDAIWKTCASIVYARCRQAED